MSPYNSMKTADKLLASKRKCAPSECPPSLLCIRYPSPSAVCWSCSSEGICRSSLTALNNLWASSLDKETPSDTDSLLLLENTSFFVVAELQSAHRGDGGAYLDGAACETYIWQMISAYARSRAPAFSITLVPCGEGCCS